MMLSLPGSSHRSALIIFSQLLELLAYAKLSALWRKLQAGAAGDCQTAYFAGLLASSCHRDPRLSKTCALQRAYRKFQLETGNVAYWQILLKKSATAAFRMIGIQDIGARPARWP